MALEWITLPVKASLYKDVTLSELFNLSEP